MALPRDVTGASESESPEENQVQIHMDTGLKNVVRTHANFLQIVPLLCQLGALSTNIQQGLHGSLQVLLQLILQVWKLFL